MTDTGNMTDADLVELEAAIYEKIEQGYLRVVGRSDDGELLFQETECAERLRARDTELAAARTLIYDLAGPDWLTAAAGLALQERARAWLASVSPPADGEEP